MTSTKEHPDYLEEPPHLEVPRVTWYKHAGLRSLYIRMPILMLCATINGYDGSLLNGLQTIENWRACTSYNTRH